MVLSTNSKCLSTGSLIEVWAVAKTGSTNSTCSSSSDSSSGNSSSADSSSSGDSSSGEDCSNVFLVENNGVNRHEAQADCEVQPKFFGYSK